ncbi:hypothetical protein CDAR_251741 [Caerostris darwini]|uniref:Uncharacterized protein n=1 Tax=Caerostris darwini TaxID=1538125 RepID=A0AAV4V4D9_9ARAC|nr:hypothetical protein CDAR_251741 [Caerostris darwini]
MTPGNGYRRWQQVVENGEVGQEEPVERCDELVDEVTMEHECFRALVMMNYLHWMRSGNPGSTGRCLIRCECCSIVTMSDVLLA